MYGQPGYNQFNSYLATQLEILKSVSLAEALVARMNLLDRLELISEQGTLTALSSLNGDKNAVAPPESRVARIRHQGVFYHRVRPGVEHRLSVAFLHGD